MTTSPNSTAKKSSLFTSKNPRNKSKIILQVGSDETSFSSHAKQGEWNMVLFWFDFSDQNKHKEDLSSDNPTH